MRKGAWIAGAALIVLVGARIAFLVREVRVRPMPEAPPTACDQFGDPLPPFAIARIGSIRFRGAAYGLGWTDAGTALVSCGEDGVVRVFDAETGLVRREFVAHRGLVEPGGAAQNTPDAIGHMLSGTAFKTVHDVPIAAAVSRDGRRIVTGGPAAVVVWDVATGAPVTTWRAPTSSVQVLAVSDDGKIVAQGGFDGRLEIHDADSGRRVARLRRPEHGRDRRPPVSAVSLSADGALVAFVESSEGPTIHLFEVATEREVGTAGGDAAGGAIAVSPRGDSVATSPRSRTVVKGAADHATIDGMFVTTLVLRDTSKFAERAATKPFRDDPWAPLAFRGDGGLVACGGRSLTLVNSTTGDVVRTAPVGAASVQSLAWSPDGRRVAGLCGGVVRVWDAESGTELHPPTPPGTLDGLSADGQMVAVGRAPSVVDLVDVQTGKLLRSVGPVDAGVNPVFFHATLSGDVVTTWTSTARGFLVRAWRAEDGAPIETGAPEKRGRITWSDTPSDSSPTYIRRTKDDRIEVLDAMSGRADATLTDVDDSASICFLADHRHVVIGTKDVRIWDVATGKSVLAPALPTRHWGSWRVEAASAELQAMAFVYGDDVHVLDVATGKKIGDFTAPENDYANPIALSRDARIAAIAGADGSVVLHDVASGDIVARLPGHRARVTRLVFSDDGRTLASSAESILVWDVARWTLK